MVQITWTFQAKENLKSIAQYISKDSKRYARLQVSKLRKRTHILKSQPYIGKIVYEVNTPNIRELIESKYRIIYKIVSPNQIAILTIHHTARDFTQESI